VEEERNHQQDLPPLRPCHRAEQTELEKNLPANILTEVLGFQIPFRDIEYIRKISEPLDQVLAQNFDAALAVIVSWAGEI
jgi:hypothetical protein